MRQLRPAAVVCRDLRRRIRGRGLIDGLTLSVPVGMRLLVVARPAASAALLLRILAGIARPDHGRFEVAGIAAQHGQSWEGRVAYIGPRAGLYPWMSPREALNLAGRLAGLEGDDLAARIDPIAAACRLDPALLDRPMSRGGTRGMRRLAFAAALLAEPEVLLLDDPFAAIEPPERLELLGLLAQRQTVLLTSSDLAADAPGCDHVALVRDGRLAALAPVSELERRGLPLTVDGVEELARPRTPDAAAAGG